MTSDQETAKEIRNAIKRGDVEKALSLIGTDKDCLEMMTPFGTWLHVAAAHGKVDIVKRLISVGADVNRRGGILGGSALNEAASEGHIDVVRHLLSLDAEMDTSDPRFNPLFGAIHGGHSAVAKLLIDSGIDTDVRYTGPNMKDMDALALAKEWGRSDIAAMLIQKKQKEEGL